ncbi:MAG: dihydropteroate synthase [Burkholderiaceae bacterium]|nr:dihydropteroate synthase [Burkholderiaceae bacterium]
MGIVNVTPDSFSDGGQFMNSGGGINAQRAIAHAQRLIEEGADILDIGGESTRPGAAPVSIQEELDRIMPVVERAVSFGVPISVDTRRPQVMQQVIAAGVDLINDVNGFRDPQAIDIAANSSCGLCIMHMLGEPATMQQDPTYEDVVAEVTGFLTAQRDRFLQLGVDQHRLLIDPGFGFGKTLAHNIALLKALSVMAGIAPVLVGVSRKRMIGEITGQQDPSRRVAGSVAVALWATAHGAQFLRVHDVRETVDALKAWAALES